MGPRKNTSANPRLDTHSRLFERKQYAFNQARANYLGAKDSRGKGYNIVSGIATRPPEPSGRPV